MNDCTTVGFQQLRQNGVMSDSRPESDQGRSLRIGKENVGAEGDAVGMAAQIGDLRREARGERPIVCVHAGDKFTGRDCERVVECADDARVGPADDPQARIGRRSLLEYMV